MEDGTGAIQIFGVKRVVDPITDPDKEISLEEAGRLIPPWTWAERFASPNRWTPRDAFRPKPSKQVILQKVREAERENIFRNSPAAWATGELRGQAPGRSRPGCRYGQDRGADSQKSSPAWKLQRGRPHPLRDSRRGKAGKNAGVIVSRAAPELVMRLFEQEVPEIYDNTVVIKGCAREAGGVPRSPSPAATRRG
jgi:N utilization substance protein A